MKKLTMQDQRYINEMEIWMKQQNEHGLSCIRSIHHYQADVRGLKILITLEQLQLQVKTARKKSAMRGYQAWRKKKGLKPIK